LALTCLQESSEASIIAICTGNTILSENLWLFDITRSSNVRGRIVTKHWLLQDVRSFRVLPLCEFALHSWPHNTWCLQAIQRAYPFETV